MVARRIVEGEKSSEGDCRGELLLEVIAVSKPSENKRNSNSQTTPCSTRHSDESDGWKWSEMLRSKGSYLMEAEVWTVGGPPATSQARQAVSTDSTRVATAQGYHRWELLEVLSTEIRQHLSGPPAYLY